MPWHLGATKSDKYMLRFFIHGNIAFSASSNPYLIKWVRSLRPSYRPASRDVLTVRILSGEASRVHLLECARLESRHNLTYLVDGWEDQQRRSIYGSMAAEVSEYPVMLGLEELTGKRATALNLVELSKNALEKKALDPKSVIATCTDNPTTMQAFRRMWMVKYPWIITFACFMHSINTIIGKITAYPPVKEAISKNTRIVTFFNNSHYWGGQLHKLAESKGVTRSLKTLTESRFYALILQAISVREHRSALQEICMRDDAQRSIQGLSPVNKDVLQTVFDLTRWNLSDQLIRICKPLVDIIGNVESRDSNLADCMLELIWAHRQIDSLVEQDDDDPLFHAHAMNVLHTEFHAMNTDLHWFALFLHPLCRKLAICSAQHSRVLNDALLFGLGLAQKWGWSRDQAAKLKHDLEIYYRGQPPFNDGHKDARSWWSSLPINVADHPLKAMAIKIFTIVPHTAEIERLFSSLGLSQTTRQSRRTVKHMQTIGMLRQHYIWKIQENLVKQGKSIRRTHAHMHTEKNPGINLDRAKDLTQNHTWVPQIVVNDTEKEGLGSNGQEQVTEAIIDDEDEDEAPDVITEEDVDREFARLDEWEAPEGDGLSGQIGIHEVYDISLLDDVWKGKVTVTIDDELELAKSTGPSEKWDPASLIASLS